MREISASVALTVYHDGQFWAGMFERVEEGRLSACRVVFGAEPSNEEVQQLICEGWNGLRFTRPVAHGEAARRASNPKRRQREASRDLQRRDPSTKAQAALSEQREAIAQERKAEAGRRREQVRRERFEQRQAKRKQKRKGR